MKQCLHLFIEIEDEDGTQGDEENSIVSNQNKENMKEVIYKVEKKSNTTTTRKIPENPGAFSTSEDNVANN